jgi:hypothetical protein
MKKLIAVIAVLCLLSASFAALAEAPAEAVTEKASFSNGVRFGMTQAEVIAIEGAPAETDTESTKGMVTFAELEYKQVPDALLNNAIVDRKYLFVEDKLVAIRIDFDIKSIAYEMVKEALAAKGELVTPDFTTLGNGVFAVDDDGTPELNSLAHIDELNHLMTVLELDADGDDVDITILDLDADYLK